MGWFDKATSAIGSLGSKAVSTFNYLGNKASTVAHAVLDTDMAKAALATQPELGASIYGALEGGDALLAGTNEFEKFITPDKKVPDRGSIQKPKPRPPKPTKPPMGWDPYAGYINSGQGRPKGPPKPERPAWTYGGINEGVYTPKPKKPSPPSSGGAKKKRRK
jgi:hypothetical protein